MGELRIILLKKRKKINRGQIPRFQWSATNHYNLTLAAIHCSFTYIRRAFWKHCEQAADININDESLVIAWLEYNLLLTQKEQQINSLIHKCFREMRYTIMLKKKTKFSYNFHRNLSFSKAINRAIKHDSKFSYSYFQWSYVDHCLVWGRVYAIISPKIVCINSTNLIW